VAGGAGIDGRVRDEGGIPMIYEERAMARHPWSQGSAHEAWPQPEGRVNPSASSTERTHEDAWKTRQPAGPEAGADATLGFGLLLRKRCRRRPGTETDG
jgi:hypothetical protein